VFDKSFVEIEQYCNLILDQNSFSSVLDQKQVLFFGNGSVKFQSVTNHPNARFDTIEANAEHMVSLGYQKFIRGDFADLAYSEPFYGKDFHSPQKQS
jgi:tRNA threonylcarbamoyladenosine biosynthesis protein TsaB